MYREPPDGSGVDLCVKPLGKWIRLSVAEPLGIFIFGSGLGLV